MSYVRKTLQSALTHIHLLIDIWTSPNYLLFLGITADFVDCKEERHTMALIALPEIDSHSVQAQFDALILVLRDYGIVRKVRAMISNNSNTNNTLA
jgi:hypothetical protein